SIFDLMLLVLPYQTDHLDERHRLAQIAERALARLDAVSGTAPATDMGRLPALIIEGNWERARQAAKGAYANNHVAWRHYALWVLATLAKNQGEADAASARIRELLPEGPETVPGNCFFPCGTNVQRIAAEMALGASDLPSARAWLEAHDRWLAWSGAALGRAEGALGWAAYQHASGDAALARRHAEQALALASEPRQPLALIAVQRFLGQLDTEARHFPDAEEHLRQSRELAEACAAPFERALTLLTLAGLRANQGKTDDARTLLAEVRAICEPLAARPTLERVAALEARLATAPKPAYPAGLTAREIEVLGLVAQGLTDAEVAERLFLSPRTVSQHLRSVYNKLGVSSRAAATRFAVMHGLVE
ncbi:MAG TPA: response regulator transcription factor, partial [Nitrolancea sp.]|nr:response regulator transcription factor [Nitrolancea sp.]